MYFTDVVVFSVLHSFSSRGTFPNGTFFFCLKDMFITFLRMCALWWLLFQLWHVGKAFLSLRACSLDKEFEALSVCACVCTMCTFKIFSLPLTLDHLIVMYLDVGPFGFIFLGSFLGFLDLDVCFFFPAWKGFSLYFFK